jgi:DNA-binding SARP family transcriptional activator
MANNLQIALLGPMVVKRGNRILPHSAWRSRQARRLLSILLAARGARVPVDRLLEWLWPDADRATAATTLRSTVSGLRRTLELEGSARASSYYILTQPGGYAWNAESDAWVDIEEFTALTDDRHDQAAGASDVAGESFAQDLRMKTRNLERAIALYHGDFLADEPDAPWAQGLREALRERFIATVHDLAERRLASEAYDAAIELSRRGLAHDRLREPLYRTLMQAQARAGDVASALQSYERCRRVLDDELGVTPSAQTRALHAAILRGDEVEMRGRSIQKPPPVPSPRRTVAPSSFVGRVNELAALRGWIGALDQRRGGVVAVVGEAGIGKTRLVAEALRLSTSADVFTITLRCVLLERGLPFAPLSEALRPLLRAVPVDTLKRLPSAALSQVANLLPVLRERMPDLPSLPVTPAEGHNQLIDGLVDLALALASDHPLIVWCDDAQWADEATLAVLGRLARRAARYALLLVLAYRSEELAENVVLHDLLRTLGRGMLLRPLVLGQLDDTEVAQFLAGLAQLAPERVAALAPRLRASSGGNPLFLSVAVQSLLETHGVQSLAALLPNLANEPLPNLAGAPPLRDLVLSRVDRLAAPARALLEQLAVIGRPASLDLIEQLAGSAGLDAARALLERQFLIEAANERLAFNHDLVRSIIAASLSLPQRRLLHRRAAIAIAALEGEQPELAAELAFHFEQSGHGAEAELLRYATAAADYARQSFGYRQARDHYEVALRAAERLGPSAPLEAVRRAFAGRLLMDEALLDWDGITATAARYERWAAQRPGLSALVAPRRLVLLRALMGDLRGAAALSVEQVRRQAESLPALDDMLWRTAIILQPVEQDPLTTGDWQLGVAAHSPAINRRSTIAFAPAHPLPGAAAEDLPAILGADEAALALFQVGWAALMQGLLADAEPCLSRSYALGLETSQAAVAVISALQLAHLNALRGDKDATNRWITTSLDTAQQAPEAAWASIWPRIHQAFLLLIDDQHAAARERFDLMAAQLRDLPAFQSHRASVDVGLGLLDLATGDHNHAAGRLEGALGSPQLLYGFVYAAAQHGLARIAALRDDLPAARARLDHTLEYSRRRFLLPEYVRTAIEIARIERDFGDPGPVLPLLRDAMAQARESGLAPLATAASALLARFAA